MTGFEVFLLIVISSCIIVFYFACGMTKGKDEYSVKGWIFAPARWLKKFLCGMFIGHDYERVDFGYQCKHCLKTKLLNKV